MLEAQHAPLQLQTRRLILIACPPEFVHALEEGTDEAGRQFDLRIPSGWPDPDLAGFLPVYANQLREDPSTLGYGVWLIVEANTRTLIGSAGFQGRPDDAGSIEVGFGVHADFRGAGYATEAVQALLGWARERDYVRGVVAHCDPGNVPSIRVLEKAGMQTTGMHEGLLAWATAGLSGFQSRAS